MKFRAVFVLLLAGLFGCGSDEPGDPDTMAGGVSADATRVTGTVMYRERIALPPGAVAEVWLLDTSRADAPAVEIAYQRIADPGTPPIPFALDYDPSKIQESMQYGVRATIRHEGQLLFTSDTHYPVLTRGAGNSADIMLVMVQGDR